MNLLSGKIVRKAGGLAFSGKAIEFFLPSTLGKAIWKSKVAINEDVSLGVRLSDTNLSDKPATGRVQLRGEIVALEARESDTIVTARVGDENLRVITQPRQPLYSGQPVTIAFSLCSVFIIRNLTGELIPGISS